MQFLAPAVVVSRLRPSAAALVEHSGSATCVSGEGVPSAVLASTEHPPCCCQRSKQPGWTMGLLLSSGCSASLGNASLRNCINSSEAQT